MTVQQYVLTEEQLRSLARGGGSPEAIALLVDTQLSRRRLYLLAAAGQTPELAEVVRLIARIDRTDPAAGRELLRYPFLDAWFGGLASDDSGLGADGLGADGLRADGLRADGLRADGLGADGLEADGLGVDGSGVDLAAHYLGALAAATAAAAGIPFRLGLPGSGADLVLPGVGTAIGVGRDRLSVRFDGNALAVTSPARSLLVPAPFREPGPHWRPAPQVRLPAHALEIVDADPLRDRYPEPPLEPMSPARSAAFGRLVAEAWQLLAAEQPEHAEGMRLALRALVPLRRPADGTQVSASIRGCFGAIGLSVPDDPQVLAELLVHEFQHEKLGALLDLIDLCADGPALFHAPWRPDPRPASALVQGVYAFAGVAGFWRARRGHGPGAARRHAEFRFAYWREQVGYGLTQLLGSDTLTPTGRLFCTTLSATIEAWREESPATAAARRCVVATQVAWRLAHQRPDPAEVADLARAWAGTAAGPARLGEPSVVPGPSPATDLAQLIEDAWSPGHATLTGATEAEQAIVARDYRRAQEMLTAPRSEREWVALAVALGAGAGESVACRRPELLRAVSDRIAAAGRAPEPESLARWLSRFGKAPDHWRE